MCNAERNKTKKKYIYPYPRTVLIRYQTCRNRNHHFHALLSRQFISKNLMVELMT